MLLRPPFIKQEDVKSQSSNGISHMERQPSVKSASKNKKKQNSLGMRKNNMVGMQYEASNMLQGQNNYDSDNGSVHSVNSRKSKGKTKESTLAIGKKQPQNQNPNQNSAYSTKNQNSHQQYEIFKLDSDDDNRSVGSHASRNSRKNTVKENSLNKNNRNSRVNVQLNYYYENSKQQKDQREETPPKTYYLEEESKVQTVRLSENCAGESVGKCDEVRRVNAVTAKNPQHKARRTEQPKPRQVLSPFEEITLKRQQDEQQPVYKLNQPQNYNKNTYNTHNNAFSHQPTSNKQYEQKPVQNKPYQQPNPFMQKNAFAQKGKLEAQIQLQAKKLKIDLHQSSTIQPQMISTKSVTKSRRNKIFDDNNNSIANSSNINTSRMEASFQRSRSKSKSKLGDLLKGSRQKKQELAKSKDNQTYTKPTPVLTPLHNKNNFFDSNPSKAQQPIPKQSYQSADHMFAIEKSNLVSVSTLHEQSRMGGQKLLENHARMEQIKPKNVQNEVFDLGESRQSQLELNLSMSNRHPELSGVKGDSVHFNFEPERKKGLRITSKEKPASGENKSLESKKHLDRLMKKCQQNEEFLAKSILSNNSELRTSQKPVFQNAAIPGKREQTLSRPFEKVKEVKPTEEEEPGWYNMVKEEPAFQIKQVERKEVRRPSEEEIRAEQKQKQRSQDYVPTPMAKGPQQLFGNPLSRPGSQHSLHHAPLSREQNFYMEQIDQQVAREQKNRILANMQKKSKTQQQKQKQQQIIQVPHSKPQEPQRQEPMSQRRDDKKKQANLPFTQPQPQYSREQGQSSSISHELSLSENGSERSNSQKKRKTKESSLNIMKKHKVQVRDQSPRAEESFYEQGPKSAEYEDKHQAQQHQKPIAQEKPCKAQASRSNKMQSSRTKVEYKKPNLINFQQSETQEEKVKSKTDMNFYNYAQMSQKSMRPPSSKPPLSRKSNASSSKSKSKAKESTLNINMSKKENKMVKNGDRAKDNGGKPEQKKKTLLDIAQDKSYEGSGYGGSDSQCSFNSRQSFGSANSRGSRKSSTSKKQSTLPITIKNKATTMGNFHPSLTKIHSTTSQVQAYQPEAQTQSIYNQIAQKSTHKNPQQKQRQKLYEQMQQRTIVSKDTYFIDERGRLVKQDLVIQGNRVYGRGKDQSAEQIAMERMRRSREHHRSRSKSRDGSRSRISKKNSMTSFGGDSQYADSRASSSNYFNGNESAYNNSQKQNLYIEQFVKPVEQPMLANQNYKFQKPQSGNQRKIQREFYQNEQQPHNRQHNNYQQQQEEEQPVRNITLNELFGRNKKTAQNANNNGKTMHSQQQTNLYTHNNQTSKYTIANQSRFIGQESRQTNRKKSLSRTQKTFHNR